MSDRLEQNLNANSKKNTTKTNLVKWKNDLIFVLTMWGSSRLVIIIAMLAIALGLLLENYPRWRYPALGFSCLLLGLFAIRFAQHLWKEIID